jgi:hypothetical protein
MRRFLAAVPVLLCLPLAAAEGETVVNLRPAKSDVARRHTQRMIRLDERGRAEIDFPTERGKLLFKFSNGVLRADVNSDGVVDEADGEGTRPRTNKPLAVRVTVGERAFRYPFVVEYAGDGHALLGGFVALRGEFEGHTIELIDKDMNGVFGERGRDVLIDGGDRASAGAWGADPTPLASVQAVGGELYDVEVLEGGMALRLSPYEGERSTLSLRVGETVGDLSLTLCETDKRFYCTASSRGETILAAGEYSITRSMVTIKTGEPGGGDLGALLGAGGIAMLYGYAREGDCVLTVRPGGNTVDAGPPFRLDFDASVSRDKSRFEVTDACLIGAAGERYRADCRTAGEKCTLLCILRSGGKVLSSRKLEYG